jgi:DUF1009 family protein
MTAKLSANAALIVMLRDLASSASTPYTLNDMHDTGKLAGFAKSQVHAALHTLHMAGHIEFKPDRRNVMVCWIGGAV